MSHWKDSAFYQQLALWLPAFAKNPFTENPELDIPRVYEAIGSSHEYFYKWLRRGHIKPDLAAKLCDLASSEANLHVLGLLERTPPKIEDFTPFFYAA